MWRYDHYTYQRQVLDTQRYKDRLQVMLLIARQHTLSNMVVGCHKARVVVCAVLVASDDFQDPENWTKH